METEQLRVAGTSPVHKLAGSLAKTIRQERTAHLDCVGAAAVNQAVKAIAVARAFLAPEGIDLAAQPSFLDGVPLPTGEARTGMRLAVRGVRL